MALSLRVGLSSGEEGASGSGFAKLVDDMKRLLQDESSSDVLFLLDNEDNEPTPVHAHRLILKTRCSAFDQPSSPHDCRLPGATVTQSDSRLVIKWPDISAKSLREVLLYLYTGLMEILDNNVFQVLAIARAMGVEELVGQCKRHIQNNLSVSVSDSLQTTVS